MGQAVMRDHEESDLLGIGGTELTDEAKEHAAALRILTAAFAERMEAAILREAALAREKAELSMELDRLRVALAESERQRAEILGSTSWRLTGPIRRAVSRLRGMRRSDGSL